MLRARKLCASAHSTVLRKRSLHCACLLAAAAAVVLSAQNGTTLACTALYSSGDSRYAQAPAARVTINVLVPAPQEGAIRLVTLLGDTAPAVSFAGSASQVATSSRGRLEVYHSGVWGTVCDDSFYQASMNVACRQLGWDTRAGPSGSIYSPVNIDPTSAQLVGGTIWLDDVICGSVHAAHARRVAAGCCCVAQSIHRADSRYCCLLSVLVLLFAVARSAT